MKTEILKLNDLALKKASDLIKSGEVVSFPTETVYGLGADVFNVSAIGKIFAAKGRPSDNPLIVHVADKSQILQVAAEIPSSAHMLIDAFVPGPITMVLPKRKDIPYEATGGLDTVGIRIPAHPGARDFISACGVPIPAPSANTSGKPSPTTAKHVYDDMLGKIPLILNGGECFCGVESTVISLTGDVPLLLRPGIVTHEMLTEVLGRVDIHPSVIENSIIDKAASPGMKYKHYSPKARVIIVDASFEAALNYYDFAEKNGKRPVLVWNDEDLIKADARNSISFYSNNDLELAARRLFGILRDCDDLDYDTVFIRSVSSEGAGLSVMNRLLRSSAFTVLDGSLEKLKTVLQLN